MKTTDENTNTEKSIIEFTPFGAKDKISLSIQIVKRLIAVKTKQGKTCSDEDAFRFMLMCQARKLNPFEGDAYLIGYDSQGGPSFSLITAHQAFLKRAELHPEFDGMQSGTIVLRKGEITDLVGDWHMPDDRILGGWATVYFKNRHHPMTKRLRLERFNKNYGIWKDDPAGMIVKCAEADALRSSFPTMLGGMFTQEEMEVTAGGDIARPVFPANESATTAGNGGATVVAVDEPRMTTTTPETVTRTDEPKKKPTLQRKTAARSTESKPSPAAPVAKSVDKTNHDRLTELLAVGGKTQQDFVTLALDQEWISLEQGSFDKIPNDQIGEFLKSENWNLIMELFDERTAKRDTVTKTAAAERGELL
jgi:phage recombination protein Bet